MGYGEALSFSKAFAANELIQKPKVVAAKDWLLKVEYGNKLSSSCSSSSDIDSDAFWVGNSVQESRAQSPQQTSCATDSTSELRNSKDQHCPPVPWWFHLRDPGRFTPWTKKSARLLELVQQYNQDAQSACHGSDC